MTILFKFLKGSEYSPSLLDDAIRQGVIPEVRMNENYVFIATDDEGVEDAVTLLKSIELNKYTERIFIECNCLKKIERELESARNKIIKSAFKKFKKYGLELIDFAIIE